MNSKVNDYIVPDFLKEFHISNFDFLLDKPCYNFFFIKSNEADEYLTKDLSDMFEHFGFQACDLNSKHYSNKFLIVNINHLSKNDALKINNLFYSNFKNTNIKINYICLLSDQSNISDDVITPFRNYWEFRTISIFDDENHIPLYYLKNELEFNLNKKQHLNKKIKI